MPLFAGPFWLRRPGSEQLERLLEEQRREELSYPAVGATRHEPPRGYAVDRYERALGREQGSFEVAVEGLKRWAPQRGAGMTLTPAAPRLVEGEVVVMLVRLPGAWVTAAVRVVYLIDEPDRFGFAYGTLPHHPEEGEEAFVVERDAAGEVRFVIEVFSRPAHPLAKLGKPIARLVQRKTTNRYLDGLQGAVSE